MSLYLCLSITCMIVFYCFQLKEDGVGSQDRGFETDVWLVLLLLMSITSFSLLLLLLLFLLRSGQVRVFNVHIQSKLT